MPAAMRAATHKDPQPQARVSTGSCSPFSYETEEEGEGAHSSPARGHSTCSSPNRSWSSSDALSVSSFHGATYGLVNEGCTCYLNALLQLLFHTGFFRSAVYRIPDAEELLSPCSSPRRASPATAAPMPKVHRALQELFFLMQVRAAPNRTTRLTSSFGWRGDDLMVQHDIQEMAALLRDRLEERMKGTVSEGAIHQLFEGKGESVVRTLDGLFTSCHRDVFYDIHLPLSHVTDLYASLQSLTAEDKLEGENKYLVEEPGRPPVYKDATKSYRFLTFPPVIWFHLKRFAMDMASPRLEMRKVNSRLTFPEELDLTGLEYGEAREEDTRGSEPPALLPSGTPAMYDLHGVIVHRGTVGSGHYYCFIREWDDEQHCYGRWIKYDDETVMPVAREEAVDRNFGGAPVCPQNKSVPGNGSSPSPRPRGDIYEDLMQTTSSAYILSYIRRGHAPTILAEPTAADISPRLRRAVQRELDAEARLMRQEQERRESLTLYIITDRVLAEVTASQRSLGFRLPEPVCGSGAAASRTTPATPAALLYPVDFALQVRKTDLVQNVYQVLLRHPSLARRGLTLDNVRLWQWDPISGGCASSDRSWSRAACVPLPTHTECRTRTTPFTNFIPASVLHRPVEMYLYLQEPTPFTGLLPGLAVHPMIRRFQCIDGGTYKIGLRQPVHVGVLSLVLGRTNGSRPAPTGTAVEDCGVELLLLNTATGEHMREPMRWYPVDPKTRIVHIPLRLAALSQRAAAVGSPTPPAISPLPGPTEVANTSIIPAFIDDLTVTCVERSGMPRAPSAGPAAAKRPPPVRVLDVHVQIAEVHLRSSVALTPSGPGEAEEAALSISGPMGMWCSANALTASSAAMSARGDEMMPMAGVPPVSPSLWPHPAAAAQLPLTGTDRILVFFKLFDYLTCTIRYLGSALVDRSCTLRSCEPLLHRLLGFTYVERRGAGSPCRHQLAFYVEEFNGDFREVSGCNDLWNCRLSSGSTVVAQYQNVPPIFRHTFVGSYAAYVGREMEVHVVQIAGTTSDNREAVVRLLKELKRHYQLTSPEGDDGVENTSAPAAPQPYLSALPVICPRTFRVVATYTCRMISNWTYVPICETIADLMQQDANRLQLYQNTAEAGGATRNAAGVLTVSPDPLPLGSSLTLLDLVQPPRTAKRIAPAPAAGNPTQTPYTLFVESLPRMRSRHHRVTLLVDVRDAAGHSLHRREMPFGWGLSAVEVVRLALNSVNPWQLEADPYNTLRETCEAPHAVLMVTDTESHVVARMVEVPLAGDQRSGSISEAGGETAVRGKAAAASHLTLGSLLSSLLADTNAKRPQVFALCIQPAAPLKQGHRRIACCHAIYDVRDSRCFGYPFFITASSTTTVRSGLERMIRATRAPKKDLQPPPHTIMMRTSCFLTFRQWEDTISSYWTHTPNATPYPASLVLTYHPSSGLRTSQTPPSGPAMGCGSTAARSYAQAPTPAGKQLVIPHETR